MSLYEELFVVGLCLYLCQDVISPGVELIHAADLKIDLLDHPELKVLGEVQDTELVDNVEVVRAVEVQDGVERSVKSKNTLSAWAETSNL